MSKVEIKFVGDARRKARVIATAQEDIQAGDLIEIDARTGRARRLRFGNETAVRTGERDLEARR